jgi:hypothetical protein
MSRLEYPVVVEPLPADELGHAHIWVRQNDSGGLLGFPSAWTV